MYKQGQAGITKATVTLVFNNEKTSESPIGYEQYDRITVTRQVVLGGRNKYLMQVCLLLLSERRATSRKC